MSEAETAVPTVLEDGWYVLTHELSGVWFVAHVVGGQVVCWLDVTNRDGEPLGRAECEAKAAALNRAYGATR